MTNHEIEANLRRTFGREAPDALPGILSDCEKQKGTVMVMEKKKRNPWVMRTVGIAAAVAVCVMGGSASICTAPALPWNRLCLSTSTRASRFRSTRRNMY